VNPYRESHLIALHDDTSMFVEERLVDLLFERGKQGHRTPDDVIVNADEWRDIARRLNARIDHQHGGKTFDDRWIFLHTVVGTIRLFGSPHVPVGCCRVEGAL
jgi:hypothetical protein